MPRCPNCDHEWQGDLAKGASIVKDAIRHPVKALKDAFIKKPEYPENCKRNCDLKACQKSETPSPKPSPTEDI